MNRLTELFRARRELDDAQLEVIEHCSEHELMDIEAACEALHRHVQAQTLITILSDFDMDGIASGVLGYAALAELGANVCLFEADPKDGYEVPPHAIDRLIYEAPATACILTCDVGTSCVAAVKHAIDTYGVEVIVTDHHTENPNKTTRGLASALVNPCRYDEVYEQDGICGAHVLWQVMDRYAHMYGTKRQIDAIRRLRVFAAIGTLSDSMPLLNENRQLVRDGLAILRMSWSCGDTWFIDAMTACQPYRDAFYGLAAVCNVFAEAGKINSPDDIDQDFLSFYVIPTFNSCKRMSVKIDKAFKVFKKDGGKAAIELLMQMNEQRKQLVATGTEEMLSHADPDFAPYVYITGADKGIRGLLAQAALDDTVGPCIVIGQNEDGTFSGSGRSPEWYHFIERTAHLGVGSGHQGAFGAHFKDLDEVRHYVEFISKDAPLAMSEAAASGALQPKTYDIIIATERTQVLNGVVADADLDVALLAEFSSEVASLGPYGRGFELPQTLLVFDAEEIAKWTVHGDANDHVRMMLPSGVAVWMFRQPKVAAAGCPQSGLIALAGSFVINEWQGNHSLQFRATGFVDVNTIERVA